MTTVLAVKKLHHNKVEFGKPRFITLFFPIFAGLLDVQSAYSAPCRPRKVLNDRSFTI
jgi:hypothetical protein